MAICGASTLSFVFPAGGLSPALAKCSECSSNWSRAATFRPAKILISDAGKAWRSQGQVSSSTCVSTVSLSTSFQNSWRSKQCLTTLMGQRSQGMAWTASSFHSVWNVRLMRSTQPLKKRITPTCTASLVGPGTVQVAANLFQLATAAVIPFYTVMILAPHSETTLKIMESELIYFILGAGYIYLLALSWTPQTLGLMFSSKYWLPELSGITQMFSSTMCVASAWLHLLAVDLFAGRQVFLDGVKHNIETRHSLILCLMMCPIGIFTHLFTKSVILFLRRGRGDPNAEVRNEFSSY